MTTTEIFDFDKNYPLATLEDCLNHPSFSHTRVKNWCGTETITIYFRCEDSPSGVLRATGFYLTPENKAVLASRNVRANLGPSRGEIASQNPPGTMTF
jgi:hypothetical protein